MVWMEEKWAGEGGRRTRDEGAPCLSQHGFYRLCKLSPLVRLDPKAEAEECYERVLMPRPVLRKWGGGGGDEGPLGWGRGEEESGEGSVLRKGVEK